MSALAAVVSRRVVAADDVRATSSDYLLEEGDPRDETGPIIPAGLPVLATALARNVDGADIPQPNVLSAKATFACPVPSGPCLPGR